MFIPPLYHLSTMDISLDGQNVRAIEMSLAENGILPTDSKIDNVNRSGGECRLLGGRAFLEIWFEFDAK